MINFPNQQELKTLRAFNELNCVTIYAPFIDPNAATNPNRIELKNLLRETETALRSAHVEPGEIKQTLRPARALLENHEFWPIKHESLALFMHPKLFSYYHIPDHDIPYVLTVGKGFNLKPLIKAAQENKSYFVLALNHNNVQLYKGDHYNLQPVRLKNFPTNMKRSLNIDEYPKASETHNIAPASTGKGSEAYHGQYNVSQTDKVMLLQFFKHIDKRLHAFLRRNQSPLILAGVNYLLPIYRQVNTSEYLLEDNLKGSFERTDLDTIRKRSLALINRGEPV